MTRFYGSVKGYADTEATRQGSKNSGIHAHPRGWDLGLKVNGYANDDVSYGARDEFSVSITGGSHGGRATLHDVLTVSEANDGQVRIAVAVGDNSFVTYLQPDGSFTTREEVETR